TGEPQLRTVRKREESLLRSCCCSSKHVCVRGRTAPFDRLRTNGMCGTRPGYSGRSTDRRVGLTRRLACGHLGERRRGGEHLEVHGDLDDGGAAGRECLLESR